ncbi:helix-turn-helix domain-containing protein [Roseomonas chloroacetimidivorans]|uniref:helix-turn-helix domain-containing protein n=1 Tax=Roseomonas chloroacetimidivorans TaxID=1766656 RepID=UPI003C77AA25
MASDDADRLRSVLRSRMNDKNLSVTAWSQRAGLPESTLRNFFAGRSETLTYATLLALARAVDLQVSDLIDPATAPQRIYIMNEAKADIWKPSRHWEDVQPSHGAGWIEVPEDPRYPGVERQAISVGDDAFDEYFPPGSILIYTRFKYVGRAPSVGDKVVCVELKDQKPGWFRIVDWTHTRISIREIVRSDGRDWLALRSRSPRWHQPIEVPNMNSRDWNDLDHEPHLIEGQNVVLVAGLVIASYRPE